MLKSRFVFTGQGGNRFDALWRLKRTLFHVVYSSIGVKKGSRFNTVDLLCAFLYRGLFLEENPFDHGIALTLQATSVFPKTLLPLAHIPSTKFSTLLYRHSRFAEFLFACLGTQYVLNFSESFLSNLYITILPM